MNCPTADKLSQYVDGLLQENEKKQMQSHLAGCSSCQEVLEMLQGEQQFIKDTLQTPELPADFTSNILDQLDPYPAQQVKKKKRWRRIAATAAGLLLVAGITVSYPSFAQLIGGMFATDQVDEGLRQATEEGLVNRVDLSVTDQGLTFKVEDIVADSSRVSLSYLILNQNGKPLDAYLDFPNLKSKVTVTDQNGNPIDSFSGGWRDDSDYGQLEFSLREYENVEQVTISFDIREMKGKTGNWQLDIPVDLRENSQLTQTISLEKEQAEHHGVAIQLKKWQAAPSSNELKYETMLTEQEQQRIEEQVNKMREKFKGNGDFPPIHTDTAIAYHIENAQQKIIYQWNTLSQGSEGSMLQSTGQSLDNIGHMAWIDSFIPQKDPSPMTFVLEGVYKAEPADFSISFKPKVLKKEPVSFEYEGNFLTIQKAAKNNTYELRKSWNPIEKQTTFLIEMEGGKEAGAAELGNWMLTDPQGNAYPVYASGSTLTETDDNARYKKTLELRAYGLDAVPEEVTLHLLSVTRYYPVENGWKVPLQK
ncbi:DUF4179 domain-containing protein [Sporosarcina sp. FSL W7-1349]|uniref:DUF4179 domain-containing protein n=1 Tax=Sporosarcina sp. FSL W7-1349 TaxID=2921561 RepID=UPI0030F73A56